MDDVDRQVRKVKVAIRVLDQWREKEKQAEASRNAALRDLAALGVKPNDIARMVGMNPSTVRLVLRVSR